MMLQYSSDKRDSKQSCAEIMSAGIHCQRLSLQRKKIHLIEFRRFNLIDFYVITSDDLFIPDYYSLSLSVLFVVLMFTCTSVQVCWTPGKKSWCLCSWDSHKKEKKCCQSSSGHLHFRFIMKIRVMNVPHTYLRRLRRGVWHLSGI